MQKELNLSAPIININSNFLFMLFTMANDEIIHRYKLKLVDNAICFFIRNIQRITLNLSETIDSCINTYYDK